MATIAAAVIGAAGAIGGGVLSSQAASKAARAAGRPGTATTVKMPDYADALNRYTARLIAANETSVAPSFSDWLKSGGTATFPMRSVDMTPAEAAKLHLVDPKTGKAIPFVDPSQTKLTPEQVLYLGQTRIRAKGEKAQGLAARYARVTNRLEALQGKDTQTPRIQRHEAKLERRQTGLEKKLGISGE